MDTHTSLIQEKKTESVAKAFSQKQAKNISTFQLVDNRSETIAQQKRQEMVDNSPRILQLKSFQDIANNTTTQQEQPIQKKVNNTGLPDSLNAELDQERKHTTVSQRVVQRVEISLRTVSPKVLSIFNKMPPVVQNLFLSAEELPDFFNMSNEEQILYFQTLAKIMPMLGQIDQVQAGQRMIGHQADEMQAIAPTTTMNLYNFFQINPHFIRESLSLFNGGGAAFSFHNPDGIVTLHLDSPRALMPPAIGNNPIIQYPPFTPMLEHREETEAERITRKKRQFTNPGLIDRQNNTTRDGIEEDNVMELLVDSILGPVPPMLDKPNEKDFKKGKSAKKLFQGAMTAWSRENAKRAAIMAERERLEPLLRQMDFHQLELAHAKLTYAKGALMGLPAMKKTPPPGLEEGITHIDRMRQSRVADPSKTYKAYPEQQAAKEETQLMSRVMPKLIELSHKIRLTHYYDSAAEESILDSGRLQSKERRIRKAKGEDVPNKSGKLDDQLGNTDHVFFFAEYQEDDEHPSAFRTTRFGGRPDIGDAILHQKEGLDGTERRVSFPLNSIPIEGVHGYLDDLNSLPGGLDVVHHVFSGMPLHDMQKAVVDAEAQAQGAHLLMDLLRQRFSQSNFPGKKNPEERIQDLENLSLPELYEFLFRRHPRKGKANKINPQILVPGSVPFQTPGVRFDMPPV